MKPIKIRLTAFFLASIFAFSALFTVGAVTVQDGDDVVLSFEKLAKQLNEASQAEISKTITTFSLYEFIEKYNLDASIIPEQLPEKTLEALEALCDGTKYAISFYYYDLTTGFTMGYEADRTFRGASSIKMPYIAYVFELIDNGKASFDDTIALKSSDLRNGTSTIRDEKFPAGTKFTVRQLVEYLMKDSDNTAFAMLNRTYSLSSFISWANSKYGTNFYAARDKNGDPGNSMTAASAGRMLRLIYERAAAGNEDYIWLLDLMKQANKNTFVKYGLADTKDGIWYEKYRRNIEVSHKYGMDVYASNDAAIVHYEDRPYVLVILTDWIGYPSDGLWWTEGDMRTVSYYVFQLHKYLQSLSEER